jgi:hypothetical protein
LCRLYKNTSAIGKTRSEISLAGTSDKRIKSTQQTITIFKPPKIPKKSRPMTSFAKEPKRIQRVASVNLIKTELKPKMINKEEKFKEDPTPRKIRADATKVLNRFIPAQNFVFSYLKI